LSETARLAADCTTKRRLRKLYWPPPGSVTPEDIVGTLVLAFTKIKPVWIIAVAAVLGLVLR
jgi:hypothetical protein